jgi:hypothetical protein
VQSAPRGIANYRQAQWIVGVREERVPLEAMSEAQDRFEAVLREQARVADARSARASVLGDELAPIAAQSQMAADALRRFAEEFRVRMSPRDLMALETWSDDDMQSAAGTMRALGEFGAVNAD